MRSKLPVRWLIPLASVAVLISLILYGYRAGFLSVCCDEFAKTVIAQRGLKHPLDWFNGIWMPLHFALIAASNFLTGDLLLSSRLVSTVFRILSWLWGIGRQFGGNIGGGLAAILGATHPLVVLLSGTAMADICYVSTYMMGLMFYLKFAHADALLSIHLFAACGFMTLACAFHYNAWLAVILLLPFLLRDLYQLACLALPSHRVSFSSGRCRWRGSAGTGCEPATCFRSSVNIASIAPPSGPFSVGTLRPGPLLGALKDNVCLYSPLLTILTFAVLGAFFFSRKPQPRQFVPWSILIGFVAALVVLYAKGGRPAAFEPRYILLPSVLMIAIVSVTLARLWPTGDKEVRAFVVFLCIAAVALNIRAYRTAVDQITHLDHHSYNAEARDIAAVMKTPYFKANNGTRMLLEINCWNFLSMPVFLNRVDSIIPDREIAGDPVHPFDNPSVLMGDRTEVLAKLRAQGVRSLPSARLRSRTISSRGASAAWRGGYYTVYRLPQVNVCSGCRERRSRRDDPLDLDPLEVRHFRQQLTLRPRDERTVHARLEIHFRQQFFADAVGDEHGVEPEPLYADQAIALPASQLHKRRQARAGIDQETVDAAAP